MDGGNGRAELGREFLRSAEEARQALARQRERVAELESRCRRTTAGIGSTPGGNGQGPERLWTLLCDARSKEAALEQQALARRRAVEHAIRGVSGEEGREVLRLRYLRGLSWSAVRDAIGCSERTVYRLHNRAAEEVGELLWRKKNRTA